ncbi:uncharacterized protein FTOL_01740 [Fusarium torulosum]|uniref:Uncharacterized protein n=1 Tax=Fusarium torulosum TaxID=33205 RepID=A0AAE8M0L9_9HYPO|nr:uncharacterized protein FTOL_01740 [Fusarium torulosum]
MLSFLYQFVLTNNGDTFPLGSTWTGLLETTSFRYGIKQCPVTQAQAKQLGAVEARRAHNPEVIGSKPIAAMKHSFLCLVSLEDLPDSGLTFGLTYGVNSRMGAQVFVEKMTLLKVRRPVVTNLDSKEDDFVSENNSEADIT